MPDDPLDYCESVEGEVSAQVGAEPGQPKSCMDADYDSGNPWSDCSQPESEKRWLTEYRAHWDSLSPDARECLARNREQFVIWMRNWRDTTPKIDIDAKAETNRFILRALEKERLDREARANGEASPCSLDADAANAVARELQ